MCGAVSPPRMYLCVVHRARVKLPPSSAGSEMYVCCLQRHCAILLRYVVTMLQQLLFGACRSLIPFPNRKPTDKTKLCLEKQDNPTINLIYITTVTSTKMYKYQMLVNLLHVSSVTDPISFNILLNTEFTYISPGLHPYLGFEVISG
jgi:hypothetical protein